MNTLYVNGAKSGNLLGISYYNPTFLYGVSCFEGVRAYWLGKEKKLIFLDLPAHIARLYRSAECLLFKPPLTAAQLEAEVLQIAASEKIQEDVYVRITFYLGGDGSWHSVHDIHYMISFRSMPSELGTRAPAALGLSRYRRISAEAMPASVKAGANYLNSRYGLLDVRARGFDDVLFMTQDNFVAEASGSTIFFLKGGELYTPSLDCDILAGITRGRILKLCREHGVPVHEVKIPADKLSDYEGAFLTGTMIEIRPVSRLESKVYQCGDAVSGRVIELLREFIQQNKEPEGCGVTF
jgi:branched-chain amino acid aminotransferase